MALNKTGEPVKVVYERDGQEYETTLTPIYNEEAGKYLVGFQNYASYDEAKGTKLFRYAWYQLRFCIKNSVLSVKSLVEVSCPRTTWQDRLAWHRSWIR